MLHRNRIALAIFIAVVNFVVIAAYHSSNPDAINDLGFPLCAGRVLLAGGDPYGGACAGAAQGREWPTNPLTTVLIALPFAPLGDKGALPVWAIMSGILAFGLLQKGERWRLLVFLSAPYWVAFLCLNWTPLMAALVMLPALTPLWLIKPQNGLPAFLTHWSWRRAVAAVAFLILSLLVDPAWPLRWWPQARSYDFYIPLIVLPFGPLILVALFFWRDVKTRYILLLSVMPQRFLYDPLLLAWIPDSRSDMLLVTAAGWIGYGLVFALQFPYQPIVVLFCYLPAVVIRWRHLRAHAAHPLFPQLDAYSSARDRVEPVKPRRT